MKKILIAFISIALVVFLSFGAYADIVQPVVFSFQIGQVLSNDTSRIIDIEEASTFPYIYTSDLLMNGNNAVYTHAVPVLTAFQNEDDPTLGYNFQGGQSYEITYRFQFLFEDDVSAYYSQLSANLITVDSYFTNNILYYYQTSGMPSTTVNSFCSNYSVSAANIEWQTVSGANISSYSILHFDVVLLFKLNLDYSGNYSKIILKLGLSDFCTALPSGVSGLFQSNLVFYNLIPRTSPSWNVLPGLFYTDSYGLAVDNGSGTSFPSGNSFKGYSSVAVTTSITSNTFSPYFMPGFSYRGSLSMQVSIPLVNGEEVARFGLASFGLSSGRNVFGGSSPNLPSYIDSSFGLTFDVTRSFVSASNTYKVFNYLVNFSFTVPDDFSYNYNYFSVFFSCEFDDTSHYLIFNSRKFYMEFDSSGTLLNPVEPDDPGGGDDDSGGSDDIDLSGIESGLDNIESGIDILSGLIGGDGSYGSPESQYNDDIDNYLSAEDRFLQEYGLDSYFNDDIADNILDAVDWDGIDKPTQDSAYWVHKIVNPVMNAFPVFIIFPLLIGVVATLLGRRYQG